jgi:restriction endonuclease S subunit
MSWQTIVKENNLEVSVITTKQLLIDNPNTRIDSDYFRIAYLNADEIIRKKKWAYLGDISKSIINFGAYSLTNQIEFLEEGVPYINVGDIKENNILLDNVKRIDEKLSATVLKKSLALEGQILLTIAGTIGNASVAYRLPKNSNSNQAIANITLNDDVSPFYVSTYLNSKYGKAQTGRLTISSVQPNLLLTQVKLIKVDIPSEVFQSAVEKAYKDYYLLVNQSAQTYKEAEQFFFKEINLEGYKGSNENISIRNFKDCLIEDRFDAEYWQPKYDEMIKRVSSVSQKNLSEIVTVKKGVETGSEAYSEEGKLFVRVSDFSIYGIDEGEKRISEELYEKLKENYKPHKGEVLFTKDGTIGISFALHEDVDVIVSGAFLRLKPKVKINTDYLALALNSSYCKSQIERMSGGAIIAHLKPDSAMKIKIPMLSDKKQEDIALKVIEALRLRKEAKALLEKAKRAVEIFIEQDEKEALNYLSK